MSEILDIETKKSLIAANWRLEDIDEVPFFIEVGPFHGATKEYFYDDDAEIKWAGDFSAKREGVYDYGFPNIKPNKGIGIVAAAFGCEYKVNNEADPWITPLIREENAGDVYICKAIPPYHCE